MGVKISLNSTQEDLLVRLLPGKGWPILFDSRSGVNIYRRNPIGGSVVADISIPDTADITNLVSLQRLGLFNVVEGALIAREAELGGASFSDLTNELIIVFRGDVYTQQLTATEDGNATDDIRISTGSGDSLQYYAATFAAIKGDDEISSVVDIPYVGDITIEITATGAKKILDANNTAIAPGVATLAHYMSVELLSASFNDDTDTLTLTFSENVQSSLLSATADGDAEVDDIIISVGETNYVATFDSVEGTQQAIGFEVLTAANTDGTIYVKVNADGMTNSPKTIPIAVNMGEEIADVIKDALIADADIGDSATGFFTVVNDNGIVTLTAKQATDNDDTMTAELFSAGETGVTFGETTTYINGSAGTKQKIEYIISAPEETGATVGGLIVMRVVLGITAGSRNVACAITASDTAAQAAEKMRAELLLDTGSSGVATFFDITGEDEVIVLERKVAASNDPTISFSVIADDGTGIWDSGSSIIANGVNSIRQAFYARVEESPKINGTIEVEVAGATLNDSPILVSVDVLTSDTKIQVASKIAQALALNTDIADWADVTETGAADVGFQIKVADVKDETVNVSIKSDGVPTGVTADLPITIIPGEWGSTEITSTVDITFDDNIEILLTEIGAAKILDNTGVKVIAGAVTIANEL